MIRNITIAAVFAALTGAAQADTIELNSPLQAASLHDGAVDMVVYFLERDDTFEVVATYAGKADPTDTQRINMAMADGDSTRFGLPEHRGLTYSFERNGEVLQVRAEATRTAGF